MSAYRTILVVLDDDCMEPGSAMQHAAALARLHNARLIVLTVVPVHTWMTAVGVLGGTADLLYPEHAYAEQMRRAVAALPPDVSVEARLIRGEPARAILEEAERQRCDVIVLRSSARGRLSRLFGRSVSAIVERHSDTPVLHVGSSAAASLGRAFDEPVGAVVD